MVSTPGGEYILLLAGNGAAYLYDAPVSVSNKAQRDERLVMYATGLGPTTGGKVTAGEPSPGDPLAVTSAVKVYFGDKRYSQAEVMVEWSGLVPGVIGVYQLDLRIPGTHMKGDALPVTIHVGGVDSPTTGGPVTPVVAVE